MSAATRAFRDMRSQTRQLATDLKSMGRTMSTYVTAPIVALGALSVRAWDQQAQAVAKVENGIRSTGGTARRTLKELTDQASALQKTSIFGDEEILDGVTAQLLTFTNIAGREFDRTQQAALDLASKLGGDLQSASIQLGKALNDPVANLSALSRSGIQFSAAQKEVIKSLAETGQLAEAQRVILDELEKQYGGTAAAAAEAGAGGLKQLGKEFGDSMEMIGELVYDFLSPLIEKLRELNAWFQGLSDSTKQVIVVVAGLAAAIGPVLLALSAIVSIAPYVAAAWALMTGPIGLAVAAVAALVAAGVLLYKNWDTIVLRVTKAAGQVRAAIARSMQGGVDAILTFAAATSTIPGLAGAVGAGAIGVLASLSSHLGGIADEADGVVQRMQTALDIRRDIERFYSSSGAGGGSGGAGANGEFNTDPPAGGGALGEGIRARNREMLTFAEYVQQAIDKVRELRALYIQPANTAAAVPDRDALEAAGLGRLREIPALLNPIRVEIATLGEEIRAVFEDAAAAGINAFAAGLGDAFGALVTLQGGFADFFGSLKRGFQQLVQQIVAAIAKMLILKGLTALLGGPGTFLGGIVAGIGGAGRAAPTSSLGTALAPVTQAGGFGRQQQATLTARTTMSGAVLLDVIVQEVERRVASGRSNPLSIA